MWFLGQARACHWTQGSESPVASCLLQDACCCLWPAPRHNKVQHTDNGQPTGTRVVRMEWPGWDGQEGMASRMVRMCPQLEGSRKQMCNEPSAAVAGELYFTAEGLLRKLLQINCRRSCSCQDLRFPFMPPVSFDVLRSLRIVAKFQNTPTGWVLRHLNGK